MLADDLRGIYYIVLKDMKAYYLKPPAISWGILFPAVLILAFYLRNPGNFEKLIPGLISMTILFSTTAMEAVVINFELRLGSLERLLLAPISLPAVLLGKVLGGVVFGLLITVIVTLGALLALGLHTLYLFPLLLIVVLSLLAFSTLGALVSVSVKEVFEAQTLANFIRFPMIFLCGVFLPLSAMPPVLRHIAYVLPLTYTVNGIEQALGAATSGNLVLDILMLVVFTLAFLFPAVRLLAKRFA